MIEGIVDANIIMDMLNAFPPAVAWSDVVSNKQLGITPTIWMEVVQGAYNKIERRRAMRLLARFKIEHPLPNDNQWAMLQFARYYLATGVDYEDVMIASVAVRLRIPLYTRNVKHFRALPDLIFQSPY